MFLKAYSRQLESDLFWFFGIHSSLENPEAVAAVYVNELGPREITKKLTDDHPSTWTKIKIVAVIVSSKVIIISVRWTCGINSNKKKTAADDVIIKEIGSI